MEAIDKSSPGTFGLYVKKLATNETFQYGSNEQWYLASTVKVLVGIATLKQVDEGKRKLSDSVVLEERDKVDGSGQLVWTPVGGRFAISSLLERMLTVSDNTAANMLIRTVGLDELNKTAKEVLDLTQLKTLTNFTQIRYDVYAQIHPDARRLTNLQLVQIAGARMGPARFDSARRAMGVDPSQVQAKTMEEAYDRFYESGVNMATLDSYGRMLEQLVAGKLLTPQSTRVLFRYMKFDNPRGTYRLEAGIPKKYRIIHKTGTQYRRACHMIVVSPENNGANAIVAATCAKDLDDQKEAEVLFETLGKAIAQTMLD